MCVLSTKFQVSSIILTSFRELEEQGGVGGGGLNWWPDEQTKNPIQIRVKNNDSENADGTQSMFVLTILGKNQSNDTNT